MKKRPRKWFALNNLPTSACNGITHRFNNTITLYTYMHTHIVFDIPELAIHILSFATTGNAINYVMSRALANWLRPELECRKSIRLARVSAELAVLKALVAERQHQIEEENNRQWPVHHISHDNGAGFYYVVFEGFTMVEGAWVSGMDLYATAREVLVTYLQNPTTFVERE